MEPFRGGLDHTREDKKPSDDKGNASDADQLPVSPSLPRGNDRRWASPCPLYEPLFRLNYVALPPRPKPAAAAIQEGSLIAGEIFEGLPLERVRSVIWFAKLHGPSPA
jgi:hypothetical protein